MRSLPLLVLCGLTLVLACPPKFHVKADIRADTNRDGRVDLDDLSDTIDKTRWNETHGAIFLPNIGDTDQRCSRLALVFEGLYDTDVPDEDLDDCHDASDNTQRSPEYLAPLKTVPIPALVGNAQGSVTVSDPTQQKAVRIFQKQGKDWVYIDNHHIFSRRELEVGLDLGIDARYTRRPETLDTKLPESWDGRVTVCFTVQVGDIKKKVKWTGEGFEENTYTVCSCTIISKRSKQVLASGGDRVVDFTNTLASITKASGLKKELYLFEEPSDRWVQDFVEPGYASMPGPNGTVSIRIMIRCPGDERLGGRQLFLHFRKSGVGAVQHLGTLGTNVDAGGNIESIPPYTFKGKTWPAGRIIHGSNDKDHHHILSYLEAQESQKPLLLDTSWLEVGHVDEFIQFIPAKNDRGWVAVISDPRLAIKILEDIQMAGHGSIPALSRMDNFPPTINQLLRMTDLRNLNEMAARRIESNIKILRREVGHTNEDIIRIPALFKKARKPVLQVLAEIYKPELQESKTKLEAYYPAVINNLVLTGYNTCVAPYPWGPVIEGKDVFGEEIRKKYAKAGMKIKFIDVWESHHVEMGAVHCGTNSIREMAAKWW